MSSLWRLARASEGDHQESVLPRRILGSGVSSSADLVRTNDLDDALFDKAAASLGFGQEVGPDDAAAGMGVGDAAAGSWGGLPSVAAATETLDTTEVGEVLGSASASDCVKKRSRGGFSA